MIFWRSIQAVVCISSSFLFIAEWGSMAWVHQSVATHLLKKIQLVASLGLFDKLICYKHPCMVFV